MDLSKAQSLFQPEPGYLNTASYGLPPQPAWDALHDALNDWRVGRTSWEGWGESTDRARDALARIVGVSPHEVSTGAQVSQLVALVAASLPAGTRVLVPDEEFTSNLFPWQVQDFDVRTVAAAELASAISADVDVVAFGLVQSSTGDVADVDSIVDAARSAGALTVVDATQAVGWLPVDATRFDAMVLGAYKWLLSPRGTAFLVTTPELRDRMVPAQAGWFAGENPYESFYGPPLRLAHDARRLDISPAWFSWVATAPALDLIEQVGVAAIHAYDLSLANRFRTGLGLAPGNSAIVSVDVPGAEDRLKAAGIRAAVRDGRLRAAFHLYNTEDDVDLALDALSR